MSGKIRSLIIAAVAAVVLSFVSFSSYAQTGPDVLKIGYAGHDHHTALYVAAQHPDLFKKDYGLYLKKIRAKDLYAMYDGEEFVCEVELVRTGGGSQIPAAMAQGTFDIGFGGLAAVAAAVDKGSPMKVISPLHSKGNMLVVGNDIEAANWTEFVALLKTRTEPLKVGIKAPESVALLIFQAALKEEGVSFSFDAQDSSSKVLFVNLKGEQYLAPALGNRIVDAYVSNNPFCALAEARGLGRSIADLNDLPPGIWKDHPCCILAASNAVIEKKRKMVVKFLELVVIATRYMNENPRIAVESASKWVGTSIAVEEKSIPTSGFLTRPDEKWLGGTCLLVHAMDGLKKMKGALAGKTDPQINNILLDLSLLEEAEKSVQARRVGK